MTTVYVREHDLDDRARLDHLYDGDIFVVPRDAGELAISPSSRWS